MLVALSDKHLRDEIRVLDNFIALVSSYKALRTRVLVRVGCIELGFSEYGISNNTPYVRIVTDRAMSVLHLLT